MFQGYTDETFEFFMAIRFNNNRDFFQASHDWYLRAVREPSLRLAEVLGPVIEAMDENMERRANRVVSRINRDLRFSRDKSPYRDYIWLAWRVPGEQRSTTLGVYFDISDQGSSYGMGYYEDNRPLMNALRRRMASEPEAILEAMALGCFPIAGDIESVREWITPGVNGILVDPYTVPFLVDPSDYDTISRMITRITSVVSVERKL